MISVGHQNIHTAVQHYFNSATIQSVCCQQFGNIGGCGGTVGERVFEDKVTLVIYSEGIWNPLLVLTYMQCTNTHTHTLKKAAYEKQSLRNAQQESNKLHCVWHCHSGMIHTRTHTHTYTHGNELEYIGCHISPSRSLSLSLSLSIYLCVCQRE